MNTELLTNATIIFLKIIHRFDRQKNGVQKYYRLRSIGINTISKARLAQFQFTVYLILFNNILVHHAYNTE